MQKLIRTLLGRIPGWAQIVPVCGVIMLMVYTWTLLWFFWKVPGWLYYLHVGEILTTLAYSLATNLAESLLVLLGLVGVALILPRKWFRDVFIARGAALSFAGLGYMMYLANQFKTRDDYTTASLRTWTVQLAVLGILVLAYLFGRIAPLRKVMEWIADRVSIFVYVLVPLSLISLLVVIIRSLVW